MQSAAPTRSHWFRRNLPSVTPPLPTVPFLPSHRALPQGRPYRRDWATASFLEGAEEEFVHAGAEVGEGGGVGVAGGAEDAVEGVGRGGGADGEAEAGDAVGAEFFEGPVGVGFGVAGFVAVVVGEAVGEDEEEPVGGAGFGLEEFAGVADGRRPMRV